MNKYTSIYVRMSDKITLSIRHIILYTLESIRIACNQHERALDDYPFGHMSVTSC